MPATIKYLEADTSANACPLSLYEIVWTHSGTATPLAKFERLAIAARKAGQDPLAGHGIWIGATLEYLLRGVPFDVVKVKGRWSSEAFTLYLTKHAQIMTYYMQAVPALHEAFVRYTMPPVRWYVHDS